MAVSMFCACANSQHSLLMFMSCPICLNCVEFQIVLSSNYSPSPSLPLPQASSDSAGRSEIIRSEPPRSPHPPIWLLKVGHTHNCHTHIKGQYIWWVLSMLHPYLPCLHLAFPLPLRPLLQPRATRSNSFLGSSNRKAKVVTLQIEGLKDLVRVAFYITPNIHNSTFFASSTSYDT